MLYDVAVMLPEEMTEELVEVIQDAFSFANPSVGRTHDNRPGTEVYLTYEAHDLLHSLRIVIEGLDGISTIESVSIDVVNGDGHRPPPALTGL